MLGLQVSGDAHLTAAESDFLRELIDSNARFILVGGYAAATYFPRGPRDDLDILIDDRDRQSRETIASAIRYHCAEYSWNLSADALAASGLHESTTLKGGSCLDILTSVHGVSLPAAWTWRCHWRDGDLDLPILCREQLIDSKTPSARPRDAADVAALRALPMLYSVPQSILAEFTLPAISPSRNAYRFNDPHARLTPLDKLTPPRLGPARRGLDDARLRAILHGLAKGNLIPPVPVFREPGSETATLLAGAHRYFASRAAAFTHIPTVDTPREVAELLFRYPSGQE